MAYLESTEKTLQNQSDEHALEKAILFKVFLTLHIGVTLPLF